MQIQGQAALVTGGASGLGEATARELARLGAKVAVLDRNQALAEKVAAEINAVMGKRVSLAYQQHLGIPSTCFGETGYYVDKVHVVE